MSLIEYAHIDYLFNYLFNYDTRQNINIFSEKLNKISEVQKSRINMK